MIITDILDFARDQTQVKESQVPNDLAIKYLNIVYHDLENEIVTKINEDFFWDVFKTDTVIGQSEYTLQVSSPTVEGIKKVNSAKIKWENTDEFFTKIEPDTRNNFNVSDDYLKEELSRDQAFFELKEGSVFIFPAPTEEIVEGLKLNAIITLKDLNLTDTAESFIFPNHTELRQFHELLAIGMKQYIYAKQRKINEKNDSINEFRSKKREMISFLTNRVNTPIIGKRPANPYKVI